MFKCVPLLAVAQFIEALLHNPESRGFDSRLCHWNFFTMAFGSKGVRCVGLTTFPPSCAECVKIWVSEPPGTFWACTGIALPFYLLLR